jgi:hypothetical protein
MKSSTGLLKVAAWLLGCSALLGLISCKPAEPRVLDQKIEHSATSGYHCTDFYLHSHPSPWPQISRLTPNQHCPRPWPLLVRRLSMIPLVTLLDTIPGWYASVPDSHVPSVMSSELQLYTTSRRLMALAFRFKLAHCHLMDLLNNG